MTSALIILSVGLQFNPTLLFSIPVPSLQFLEHRDIECPVVETRRFARGLITFCAVSNGFVKSHDENLVEIFSLLYFFTSKCFERHFFGVLR